MNWIEIINLNDFLKNMFMLNCKQKWKYVFKFAIFFSHWINMIFFAFASTFWYYSIRFNVIRVLNNVVKSLPLNRWYFSFSKFSICFVLEMQSWKNEWTKYERKWIRTFFEILINEWTRVMRKNNVLNVNNFKVVFQ